MWNNIRRIDSKNEFVSKYVFEADNAVAESVLYKYPTYKERTVVCSSTQSGCPIGCRFCGSGDFFIRNLTTEEIVSQPLHLFADRNIDGKNVKKLQIMFMSMGEPLLNFTNLSRALVKLYSLFPNAKLLISTSAPKVDYKLVNFVSKIIPTIGLQFSVHESTDEARNKLIPFKSKLSLEQIGLAGEDWFKFVSDGRRPFFNYCVHDKNNTQEDVDRLVKIFKPEIWESTISVICERGENVSAASERQRELAKNFMDLMLRLGYSTRLFDPAGQDDIGGGCGQLWYVQDWVKKNKELAKPSAGNGLETVHTPR